jgi:hypothetical protein
MFRKLLSVVAIPAFLSLLTAGALQARPLAVHAGAPTIFQELWQWVASGALGSLTKEGPGMDPNGTKPHGPNPGCSTHEAGTRADRTAVKER